MSVTAKELAARLGLSEAAVSFALNNKPGVSTATRKRVLAAAEAGGYDFTKIRASAPAKNGGTICFVIYRKHGAVVSDTPFFSQLTEGIDSTCRELPYFLSIQYLHERDSVRDFLQTCRDNGCRGLILLGTEMQPEDLTPFLQSGLPTVLLDNYFESLELDSVLINNIRGAYTAADYLIRKHGEQPGYLRSVYPINNFDERADGFYKAIRKNGMSPSRSIVHRLSPSAEGAYADMKELLTQREPVARSYFADNDLIAVGAMRAFREFGYRIPEDIAIIGFDNMPVCTYVDPPLTTIHVPKQYLGRLAVRRLHELITAPDSLPVKIEISTSLQLRRSC